MRVLFLAFALMAASIGASAASADSKCKYQRITELPIWIENGRPVTVGYLNGRKVGILIDTGSGPSFVERPALERLGRTVRKDWQVLVSPEDSFGSDIAVSLGSEFFRNVDVEFDFPNAAVRLYQAEDCEQAALSYWTGGEPANELPIERSLQTRLTLRINGQPVRAQLDSGAGQSVIDSDIAARLGVTPRSAGVLDGGCSAGLGRNPIETWIAPVDPVFPPTVAATCGTRS